MWDVIIYVYIYHERSTEGNGPIFQMSTDSCFPSKQYTTGSELSLKKAITPTQKCNGTNRHSKIKIDMLEKNNFPNSERPRFYVS